MQLKRMSLARSRYPTTSQRKAVAAGECVQLLLYTRIESPKAQSENQRVGTLFQVSSHLAAKVVVAIVGVIEVGVVRMMRNK
jgi:hypothetical protein